MDTVLKLGGEELTHLIEESIVRQIEDDVVDLESNRLASFQESVPEQKVGILQWLGFSGEAQIYTPADTADTPREEIGLPGRYPFTRGPYPPCTGLAPGPCARSPVSAPAPRLIDV